MDNIFQRFFNIRILKLESGIEEAAGDHALTFEQHIAEFAENQLHHEGGCGHR